MNVRCGECNKLFRVSDDKITGTGIKFLCTRCGAYVRIIREHVEQDTPSPGAVTGLDLFEPQPGPAAAPLSQEASELVVKETAPPEHEREAADPAEPSAHGDAPAEQALPVVEPDQSAPAPALNPEPAVELNSESLMPVLPQAGPHVEPQSEPSPEQKPEPLFEPQPQEQPATEREIQPEPATPMLPVSPPPAPPVQPAEPKKESTRPVAAPASFAAEQIVVDASKTSHSGRMLFVLLATLIIAGAAVYGMFDFFKAAPTQTGKDALPRMISMEGLQLANLAGTLEANGDLLITGVVENATVKEKTSWYVVAVVNNIQGSELIKIRFLNGNQIFTRRDYDILAKRGINVQELIVKSAQAKGVAVPPMGSAKFEVRYLQPPPGIASFHAQMLPFDPVQLNKEIAEEIK